MEENDLIDASPERIKRLGFKPQKEIIYNKLLPYSNQLDEESNRWFKEIKANLSKAVMLREIRPACGLWSAHLTTYIKLYGLKFSKEDHVSLIHLMYEVLTIPKLEPYMVNKFAKILIILLKKKYLLRQSDLVLQWRPLYDLCSRIIFSNQTHLGMYRYCTLLDHTLCALILSARYYFPESATQEILDIARPPLSPLVSPPGGSGLLVWFLPVSLPPEKSHLSYKLWFEDIMEMWIKCNTDADWDLEIMCLIAALASNNIGYIDWEPYIPSMFSRFLRSFNLPVVYKNQQSPKLYKVETCAVSLWIVSVLGGGSSCQKYLDKFLKTIESYFHPANLGVWFMKLKELFRKLPQAFVHRLHVERYRKRSWHIRIRESHKLTEEDIDRFVASIKRIARQAVFSKWGCNDVSVALQKLAILRPKVIIPMLIERMYSTLDSVTEPHKLTSVMQCVVAVARTLVQGARHGYPEGPTHVIPMLMMTLPGIDANDFRKCVVTFQFISMFVALIPIIDSSKASEYHNDLTEEEEVICTATANFEDFVAQFFDRIFSFIDSSTLEATRMEKDSEKRSKLETLAECALSSVCYSVLSQCSSTIFKTALKKLHTFLTDRIFETKVAGRFIAGLCGRFARVNPEETLKCLVPHLCNTILLFTESPDIQKEETLDDELLYNMLLLSELVDSRRGTLPYIEQITAVLDRTLHLSCEEGFAISSKLLNHLLVSLTSVGPLEHRALNMSYDESVKNHLPIREWGKPGDIHNLNLKWHVPGPEEIQCVRELVHKYLSIELDRINKHILDEKPLSREELLCSLHIILGILGAQPVLPPWKEEAIPLVKSCVKVSPFHLTLGLTEEVNMPDGSNVRYVLAHTMDRLQKKILISNEDDTKSLFSLIKILELLLLNKANSGGDFFRFCKNYKMAKKVLEDPLVGRKSHVRALMIDRTALLHEGRRETSAKSDFTETHRMMLINLLQLSCSQYSEVRSKAQTALFKGLNHFSNSYTLLTDHLLENLKKDSIEHHEIFKGSLYVLLGSKESPIIARHDWDVISRIWPAIIRTKPSEKLSVIKLLDSLVKNVQKYFPTLTIDMDVPDSCVQLAKALWLNSPRPNGMLPSENEIADGLKALQHRNEFNLQKYYETLESLVDAVAENNLHWRYHAMAVCFIRDLVHPNVKYPPRVVRLFLKMLINDSLELRKMAVRATVFLLKQQKRPHKKVKVDLESLTKIPISEKLTPGIRADNMWMQYNFESRPMTSEEWDKLRYIHKPNVGFFQWPKYLELYAPAGEQPPIDRADEELLPEEREVYNFFINPKNVDQLIKYFSLEEKKGKDKFCGIKSVIFKGLFRNHGDKFLEILKPHLLRLVADKHESSQRCAAEIIAGIIRGSKLWPFEKVASFWEFLCPLIRTALANMSEETVLDWGICFATAAEKRDPNRHHWMLELLMEDPLRDESSFLGCGRLYALQSALNQHEWRVSELYVRLLKYFRPFLTHPFQNVRNRIAKGLTHIFQADISVSGSKSLGPHVHDFMLEIVQRVNPLYSLTFSQGNSKGGESSNNFAVNDIVGRLDSVQLSDGTGDTLERTTPTDSEKEVCIRLFKTICKWISHCLSRIQGAVKAEYFYIFPLLCLFESYDQDDELGNLCSSTLAALARSIISHEHVPIVLTSIRKVARSGSWWAKSSVIDFLQVFIFHNMFTLLSNPAWTQETTQIVLEMLEDERLEVREKAAEVLGGLLHIDFIPDAKALLDDFKKKANTKMKSKNLKNSGMLRIRHSGILGLCAFINSSPYDVPECVPAIFLLLGNHLNDPLPIPSTIRKTLNDFKRTHHDNWEFHQQKFTKRELEVLNDLIIPPTYYA